MAPWFRSRSAVRSRSDSNLSAHRSNNLPQQEFLPHLHPSTTANFFQDTLSISGSSTTQTPTVLQPIIRQTRSQISQPCVNGSGRFENGSQIRSATRMQAQGEIKNEAKVQTQRHSQNQIQTPTYPQTQPQAQPQIQTHIQLSPTSSATPSTPSSTSEQYPPFQTRQRSIRFKPETFERGNPRQSRSRNHVRSQSYSTCYTPPASVSRTPTTASIDDTLASKSKGPTVYTTAYTTSTATVTTATATTATPTPTPTPAHTHPHTFDMDHQRQQQPPPSSLQPQSNLPSRPRSVSNPMDIFLSSLQPQPSSTPQRALSTNTRRHSGLRRAGAAVFAAARRRTGHRSDSDSDGETMPTQEQTQAQIQAFLQLQPAPQPAPAPQSAPQKAPQNAPQQPKGAGHSRGRSIGDLAGRSNGPAWLGDEEAYRMGPCMTCDAQMRWPREAEAFRCTGCLTINDVIPRKPQRIEPSASATTSSILLDRSHTESSLHKIPRKPVRSSATPSKSMNIISIETTKTIIVECLEQFLFGVLFSGPANRTAQNGTSNGTSEDNDFGTRPRSESRIEPKRIFRRLEDYIMNSFSKDQCVNSSFSSIPSTVQTPSPGVVPSAPGQTTVKPRSLTGVKSPHIDWDSLLEWYNIVINVGENWQQIYSQLGGAADPSVVASINHVSLERQILQAQEHVQKALLKATEQLLKRPGRLLKSPDDIRFLLIIIENPLLGSDPACFQGVLQPDLAKKQHRRLSSRENRDGTIRPLIGYHSGIIKRIFGLLSNASPECQNHLRQWWARFSRDRFIWTKDMASRFLAYRLTRHREKQQRPPPPDPYSQLIPEIPSSSTAAQAHSAIESFISAGDTHNNRDSRRDTKKNKPELHEIPRDDWQIKAVTKILSLLFAANEIPSSDPDKTVVRHGIKMHTKYVPASDFYIPMLDLMNSADDFDAWENRSQQFCFCQYPFLLGMAAKKQIIEHDAKRQMAARARDAFFSRVLTSSNDATNEALERFFVLDVRRDCLVEDSFRGVSSAMTSGPNNLKKGLRIVFRGEEGLDYGGPRKEWFLQLVRELFNPDHGLFVYDEDSHFCYFNPYSLEHSDTYFLVGIVLGLAIYNSTILDVALPPFAFRKLMAAAPHPSRVGNPGGAPNPSVAHRWAPMTYSLADLAEYRPRLAIGLQALLDYEGGDVEDVFCLDFTITVDRFGTPVVLPLCPGGASRPVTSANRHEYVSLYVRFVLDSSVTRQFEPFCRGFYTVCAGSTALSLCQPEEVELLIRGSDEALDIDALRAVAVYENWRRRSDDLGSSASGRYRRVQPEEEPVVRWFWQTFAEASPQNQRKLLVFITGSDRIPAGGAASLVIKVTCLGDDVDRFPIARTCFNMLSLYRYRTKAMLEQKLWMAVHESEGFGLK